MVAEIPLRGGAEVNAISLRGVSKSFGGRKVIDDIDLDVRAGESLVLVGGSGTGKSVTLKHMIGLIQPDAGSVFVDGIDLAILDNRQLTNFRRRFGMAFQEGALFDSLTVAGNVGFPLQRAGWDGERIRQRVAECLDLVHLEGVENKMPAELSGGMRRRVGFARAIAHRPEILLFDEPNTGLDPIMTDVIDEVILEMKERLDVTIVTITHHMESARKIGDRIALLAGGRILFEAPPEEFLRSDHPAVRQFVQGSAKGPLTVEFQREESPAVSEVP
jgi:phospholipid/cholesterol/gamma-HCH transport system ATP-binding protein